MLLFRTKLTKFRIGMARLTQEYYHLSDVYRCGERDGRRQCFLSGGDYPSGRTVCRLTPLGGREFAETVRHIFLEKSGQAE